MILLSNLDKITEMTLGCERVLDVGGGRHPLNTATHVIDLSPYDARNDYGALTPGIKPRFGQDTWKVHDVCVGPWDYPDKYFDFSFCSHLLEDVRDPLAVCRELVRVSKAGYIEVPSREREIFAKARFFSLKSALGRMPEVGFHHHRWFVEIEGTHIRFLVKDQRLLMGRDRFITRGDLGRKMTEQESGACLFWDGNLTFEEVFYDGHEPLVQFRNATLQKLKRG